MGLFSAFSKPKELDPITDTLAYDMVFSADAPKDAKPLTTKEKNRLLAKEAKGKKLEYSEQRMLDVIHKAEKVDNVLKEMFGKSLSKDESPYKNVDGTNIKVNFINVGKGYSDGGMPPKDIDKPYIKLTMEAEDDKGPLTAKLERTWRLSSEEDGNKVEINNDYVVAHYSRRGVSEFVDNMTKAQMSFLQEQAPDRGRITLHADSVGYEMGNTLIGGYAWASKGYSFANEATKSKNLDKFEKFCAENGIELGENKKLFDEPYKMMSFDDGKKYVYESNKNFKLTEAQQKTGTVTGQEDGPKLTPEEISQGSTQRMSVTLGQKFLLEQGEWYGKLDIPPQSDAYKFAQAYEGAKKFHKTKQETNAQENQTEQPKKSIEEIRGTANLYSKVANKTASADNNINNIMAQTKAGQGR